MPTFKAKPHAAERLESRLLCTSISPLLQYDFNSGTAWPAMSASATNGGTATAMQGAYGTIDTEGGTTPTGGLQLTASPPSSGSWTADLNSGELAVSNTITNLGLLTLNFTLSASQGLPVRLRVFSYASATGSPSGGLETLIYPATSNYNQHFAVDLSSMNRSGAGTFNPAAPYISFSFEMTSIVGWSAGSVCKLDVDNVNYSKPAYYVSATGSNSNNGLTTSTAFATPAKAVSVSQPGDIIEIMTGTYTISDTGANAIHFSAGGTPADWITLKNYPGQTPEIQSEWWNAILIGNGSSTTKATTPAVAYINIRGLYLRGDADYAQTTYNSSIGQSNPQTNGDAITVDGRYETNHPHDFLFNNNLVEYFSGGGIGGEECDRIDIENNVIENTSWWTIYATSGISILSDYNFDGTTNLYTRIVRDNSCSGSITNEESDEGEWSDGNGIIIDLNVDTGYLLSTSACLGRTLVEDNASFNNGGSGIHAFESNHVDIINNVAYNNGVSPYNGLPKAVSHYSQIFAASYGVDTDIHIYNNILVAPTGSAYPVNTATSESASFFHDNLYYGGNGTPLMGTGDRILNPQFVNPTTNPTTANFELLSTSPAINAGTTALAPLVDIVNNVRNGIPDIGAYEYYSSGAPTVVTAASASPAPVAGTSTTLSVLAGDAGGPTALTYAWAATALPPGAASPTFDPNNGTNVTYVTSATFSQAGTYTLTVTVTDTSGYSATSSVNVVVNQTITAISLSPTPTTIAGGTTQQYTASVTDQFGQPMNPTLNWNASGGGTVSSSGLFTANQVGGSFSVTATSAGITGSATVSIVPTIYTGTGYYVRLAPDGVTEQIWIGTPGSVGPSTGNPTYSIPLANLPSLSFGPGAGAEALTIDLQNGKPIPAGSLNYNGSTGSDSLSIRGSIGNDAVTVNATQVLFGSTPITYTNIGSIQVNLGAGSDVLTQSAQPGNGATLSYLNPTANDALVVSGGTFTFPPSTSGFNRITLGNLNISSGAGVVLYTSSSVPHTTRSLLVAGTLSISGTSVLDLQSNDLIVSNDGLSSVSTLVQQGYASGQWNGVGAIISSSAAQDSTHLTALGVIQNTLDGTTTGGLLYGNGTLLGLFDGYSPLKTDVLVKYTYYGDTNLDGAVDGTDYGRLDSASLADQSNPTTATGWYNGDLNYDGVVDGSDYTLIDNAFNSQGASLAAQIADPGQGSSAQTASRGHPLVSPAATQASQNQPISQSDMESSRLKNSSSLGEAGPSDMGRYANAVNPAMSSGPKLDSVPDQARYEHLKAVASPRGHKEVEESEIELAVLVRPEENLLD